MVEKKLRRAAGVGSDCQIDSNERDGEVCRGERAAIVVTPSCAGLSCYYGGWGVLYVCLLQLCRSGLLRYFSLIKEVFSSRTFRHFRILLSRGLPGRIATNNYAPIFRARRLSFSPVVNMDTKGPSSQYALWRREKDEKVVKWRGRGEARRIKARQADGGEWCIMTTGENGVKGV